MNRVVDDTEPTRVARTETKRANVRLAVMLALLAVGFYVLMIFVNAT